MDYIQKAKPRENLVGLKVSERIDTALQFQKDFLDISSGPAERTERRQQQVTARELRTEWG
jgi:hypothetical protein